MSAREQRSEKALLLCLTEKDVRGDSIREARTVTEELCGHGLSASTVSPITVQLDTALERFMRRLLTEPCLQELRWRYDRRDATEARTHLQGWLTRWQDKHAKLCAWVEANIEETFAYYRLPLAHHKHLKSTNLLERLNQEFKRRTHIVRIFTDEPCCLRLIRALAVETHEEWIDGSRYLNMEPLRELLRKPAPERKAA